MSTQKPRKRYTQKGLARTVEEARDRTRRLEGAKVESEEQRIFDAMHLDIADFLAENSK